MIDNPNDARFDEIFARLGQLESGSPLGFSSITRGSLRVASAEGLIVEGSQRVSGALIVSGTETVDGLLQVTGTLVVSGNTSITGPTSIDGSLGINGPTTINGPTVITGTFGVDGDTTISGEVDLTGTMTVTGEITVDGAGRITVGSMVLDPDNNGGSLKFSGGPEVYASGGTLSLYSVSTGAFIELGPGEVKITGPSLTSLVIDGDGMHLLGLPVATDAEGIRWIAAQGGRLVQVPPGVGGPTGGAFEHPFPPSTITYGFRPPDRPTHDGLDYSYPGIGGAPIRASSGGVVAFAGWSDGYGWYVDIDHAPIGGQSVMTRYGHMASTPVVSTGQTVAKLTVLGPVGDTGRSEGDHLHFEVHVNGAPVDPQEFLAAHGDG